MRTLLKPVFCLFVALALLKSLFVSVVQASEPTTLNFSLLVFNGEQRSAYAAQVKAFEQAYPHIKVNMRALESERYKQRIESWLRAESHSDVMYWFGGERLNWYIRQGWVRAIDDLWQDRAWDERITSGAKTAVTTNGKTYALPIHYYHWGLYYKKSLFQQLKLKPPRTWEEFIAVCDALKRESIAPIALGSKEVWPVASWFDYFNLRLNGLAFHRALVGGEVSYLDERLDKVFAHWRSLIDSAYFLPDHNRWTWREVIPFLYRGSAGMFLMGNFWTSQIPAHLRDDFEVIPFPLIDQKMPFYEEAPTNVLFIPRNVKNLKTAELFLDFMAQPQVQAELNEAVGMMAPQRNANQQFDHFLKAGKEYLKRAEGISQYYDRDNPKPIATKGMEQLLRFMNNPDDLPKVRESLEALRSASFDLPQ